MSCSGNGRPAWRYGRIPRRRAAGGALLATPSADRPKRLCKRQRLEPSLTQLQRQRLEPSLTQLQEAKAGAFAYTTAEAKAGAFAYTTAEAKAGAFAYNSPMTLWRSIP
jgi:hypothetical protein